MLDHRPVTVTSDYDGTARAWDLATGEKITRFTGPTSWVHVVACSVVNDRPVAITGSDDKTVRVWDLTTTDELGIFDYCEIGSAAVGPNGELVVATGWDLVVLDRTAKH